MNKLAAILHKSICSVMLLCCVSSVSVASDVLLHAQNLQLADHPAWHALIHLRGEVSDSGFYLAPTGRTDATAELAANLDAMQNDHAYACRFPARRLWLQQALQLPATEDCAELQNWKQKLAADRVTLLFPAMYLHNPASMFGHTFLRLDQSGKSPLLAYTLSYAAKPDAEDNVLLYVYKGVFGGYPGVFAVQPYYQTVTDYGDIEHRDIWEYELNLNAEEINQLLNHVWELRDKKLDYFFLRENCAYQLLSLLDVARPGADMRNAFSYYAIPAETVKQVNAAGLITNSIYRPSRSSRIQHMQTQMQAQEFSANKIKQEQIKQEQIKQEQIKQAPIKQAQVKQARQLELDAEIKQYHQENANEELTQRSQLPVTDIWLPFTAQNPLQSHSATRMMFAAGEYENQTYTEISWRPAIHDTLDKKDGLIEGATIETLQIRARYYPEQEQAQLQSLTLFGMQSLSPVTSWHTPMSFELALGMRRLHEQKNYYANAGAGLSARHANWLGFALLNMEVETVPERDSSAAVLPGVHAGIHADFSSSRLLLDMRWQDSVMGFETTRQIFSAGYQFDFSHRSAMRVGVGFLDDEVGRVRDVNLGWVVYW